MLIDIHTHSHHTPGSELQISELVLAVKERGLDGFCLTDLHTVAGGPEAKRLAAEAGLVALLGFEAQTDKGHFLVFVPEPQKLPEIAKWLRFDHNDLIPYTSLALAIENLDGVLVAAHPYDRSMANAPGDSVVQLEGVAALEVNNARRPVLVNDLAEEVAAGLGLPGVAGSDAKDGLGDIGKAACLVHGPVNSEADLIDCIRSFTIWPVKIGDRRLAKSKTARPQHRRRGGQKTAGDARKSPQTGRAPKKAPAGGRRGHGRRSADSDDKRKRR